MNLLSALIPVYIIILVTLFIYGSNCLLLTYLHRKKSDEKTREESSWYPLVTVQLPVYNELYVVERLIRKASEMDYPENCLEIQVLDDSTDETSNIIQQVIEELKGCGINIYSIHRTKRDGYKAGALREGLNYAKGEFIAVFDADFLPARDFLKKCIPYFSLPAVGMVQTRWGHINDDYSLLTRALSIGIDGHFQMEQNARYGSGLFLNFNGTAGIWRKRCIEDSGGWQADTLTEDLDLSYRAQLGGWKFVFLENMVSPAEVPVQINAFKRQQFRWAKGSMQCAKKLLPQVAKANIPFFKKIQAFLHLTYYCMHPLMVALLLLSLPLILFPTTVFFYFQFFTLGTIGPLTMYALSQRELYENWKSRLKYLPLLTIIGTGISANNTKAVLEGLFNRGGTFQRTPKFGIQNRKESWDGKKYRLGFPLITVVEAALGSYALVALYLSLRTGSYFLAPFLALYALGYFFVCGLTIMHSIQRPKLPRLDFLKRNAFIIGILALAAALRLYRVFMGDLSEDPYHHWLISAYLAFTGSYADPLGAAEVWLPFYHIIASAIILVFGRDILWLKLANTGFSLGGIYLAYLIAGRYSQKAGVIGASFLALNPFEILTSSTAYTEPAAVFFFLAAVYLMEQGREKAGGLFLFLSAATRYEVWLAIPFLFYAKKGNRWYFIAPSLIFIIAWSIYTAFSQGFFPESIIEKSREVLNYEIGSGAVKENIVSRTSGIVWYFFISAPLVYAAGLYFAIKNLKKGCLFAFAVFNLASVFLITASGIAAGSFRYFSLAIPLLSIFAAAALSKSRWLSIIVLASLIVTLPFYFNLYSSIDTLYQPLKRGGEFVGNADANGLISNSPVPLYYSNLPAGHLFGSALLRNMNQEQAIEYLEKKRVDYIVYVDSPAGELNRIFPGIETGKNFSSLTIAYDPNGWEQEFGAKRTYVYELRHNGKFKSTGSYVSSSPQIADIDGDGYNEIIAASDRLYIWKRDGSSIPGFPAITGGLIASTPNMAHTKYGNIIFAGSDDNKLYAWWYNGSSVSGFPVTTKGDVFSKPLLVDMDNDNEMEVVVGSDDTRVYAWKMNGSAVKGWPVQTQGYVSSSPVAADLDGDGEPEIIAGSWDKKLYAWHNNGSLVSGFPILTGEAIWSTPRIVDINNDGKSEIVAASDMVYVWNSRGEQISGFPLRTVGYIISSPLVEDIDHDGSPEIVVAGDALYVYNSSGALKEGWPVYTGYYFWASPAASDLDGDGLLEIVIGDLSGRIYAFKHNGSMLKGFPKQTSGKIFASAALGDINKDGNMEVVAGSWDKGIYLWDVERTGSYHWTHSETPGAETGQPVIKNISISNDNGVIFLAASIRGKVEKPELYYYGDDESWHPSPMLPSEGMYIAMIAPQKQRTIKYYISLESENISYRFPEKDYYELKN